MDRDSCFSSDMGFLNVAIMLILGLSTLIMIRLLYVIYRRNHPLYCRPPGPLSAMIVLGSGGHTAEMLNLLAALQIDRFKPRYYIAAATDNMSLEKAKVLENSLLEKKVIEVGGTSHFLQIYQSHEVGQSYITSVGTTLIALTHALWLMIKIRPQVILCNGPGACIPLCVTAFLFKVADQLFVQWPQLKSKYPRANYGGRLM